jgi:hypothetical protein
MFTTPLWLQNQKLNELDVKVKPKTKQNLLRLEAINKEQKFKATENSKYGPQQNLFVPPNHDENF